MTVRKVDDVETLKALGDPLRLAILRVLMAGADGGALPVRSVKDLARELGEQPTKLYRHVKQLQARGLIETAETRLVAGIVEHRYRASQSSLMLDSGFFTGHSAGDDTAAVVAAAFEDARNEYLEASRSGRLTESAVTPIIVGVSEKIPADKAEEFRTRLAALVQDLHDTARARDGVEVRFFTAFYSPGDPEQ